MAFRHPMLRYSASARSIDGDMTVRAYLQAFFPYVRTEQIDGVFGFVDPPVPLYGGRVFRPEYALRATQWRELTELGLQLFLPMTNHWFDAAAYEASLAVLAAHHREGNGLILINDEFARQVRQDFPLYKLKASVVRKLLTPRAIETALELYDLVVLPAELNDRPELLASLGAKERIELFGAAGCDYSCPARICYPSISRINRGELPLAALECSARTMMRAPAPMVYFEVERLAELGFRRFKLVPDGATAAAARVIAHRLTDLAKADGEGRSAAGCQGLAVEHTS